jgi:hypothetical protein
VNASTARPSEIWYRNTTLFNAIRQIVTTGVVREGMMSRRGIMQAQGSGGLKATGFKVL